VGAAIIGSRFFACLAGVPKGLLSEQFALTWKITQRAKPYARAAARSSERLTTRHRKGQKTKAQKFGKSFFAC
jgi:hypothetical protein